MFTQASKNGNFDATNLSLVLGGVYSKELVWHARKSAIYLQLNYSRRSHIHSLVKPMRMNQPINEVKFRES